MKRVMKKVYVGLVLCLCMIAYTSTAIAAEIPFEAEIVVTAEELSAIAGVGEVTARVITFDLDGGLIVKVDGLDYNQGMAPGALLKLDVSQRPVTGSVIVPEVGPGGLNDGQAKPTGDVDFTNIVVSSDGTIWAGDFDGDDEILAIRRGDTVTVKSVLQAPGLMGIGLGCDENGNEALWWIEEKAWQHQDSIQEGRDPLEGLLAYTLPDGPLSMMLISPDFIRTATDNPRGPGLELLAAAPDGSFALALDIKFRSASYQHHGSDQLLRFIPFPEEGGHGAHRTPIVDIPYPYEFFDGLFPRFMSLTIDKNGVIYGWNLPGGEWGKPSQLEIIKGQERMIIPESDIVEKANIKPSDWGTLMFWRGQLCVRAQDDGSVILYGANMMDGSIIKITLPPGTSSVAE